MWNDRIHRYEVYIEWKIENGKLEIPSPSEEKVRVR